MSAEGKGQKRSKAFYRKSAHGGKRPRTDVNVLAPGLRGFLVMCNNNESGAVRESYNILNEYADRIYGQGNAKMADSSRPDVVADVENTSDDDSEEDVEKALRKEVEEIKTVPAEERRFQNCMTKAKNCVFIRSTVEDPVKVAQSIMEDIAEKRVLRARYAARILPVVGTCKAHTADIERLADKCLSAVFSRDSASTPASYTIVFKTRNNNTSTCGKASVIPALTRLVTDMNPDVKFSWSEYEVAIVVEIVCTVCCLAVAPGFLRLRKYNLQELQQGPRPHTPADKTSPPVTADKTSPPVTADKTSPAATVTFIQDSGTMVSVDDQMAETGADHDPTCGHVEEGSLVSTAQQDDVCAEGLEDSGERGNVDDVKDTGVKIDDVKDAGVKIDCVKDLGVKIDVMKETVYVDGLKETVKVDDVKETL
ncbi:THUMP domain-containing protein 1 [Aplysia californica]|uniref:THUMP domain-containing protein 1 n=1 Tax=Aplysia californica TaxID=6500 RepID=A0ABM0JB78_APLCA|nr:THUMP domain-containing protein 1 [Aplysia californica]